jgi:hypothetical protein
MGPRLALLREEIDAAETSRGAIGAVLDRPPLPGAAAPPSGRRWRDLAVGVAVALVRSSPPWLRDRARRALRAARSNERVLGAVWRFCPEPVLRFYRRVRDAS